MKIFSIIFSTFLLVGCLFGQEKSAYCVIVTDEVGATIPSAVVKFKSTKSSSSKIKYESRTDDEGKIHVEITEGIYNIEIKAETYKGITLKNQILPTNHQNCVQIKLKSKIPPHQIT